MPEYLNVEDTGSPVVTQLWFRDYHPGELRSERVLDFSDIRMTQEEILAKEPVTVWAGEWVFEERKGGTMYYVRAQEPIGLA